MKRKLHTKTKIFFPNPYVYMVNYDYDIDDITAMHSYQKFCRKLYRLIQGTMGYSELREEYDTLTYNSKHTGYIVFKDEIDVLQVKLACIENLQLVKMWPELYFTIHEVEYENS